MKYIFILIAFVLFANFGKLPEASLVLKNGNIVTIKARGDRAQAIAIKDGNILAVGTNKYRAILALIRKLWTWMAKL